MSVADADCAQSRLIARIRRIVAAPVARLSAASRWVAGIDRTDAAGRFRAELGNVTTSVANLEAMIRALPEAADGDGDGRALSSRLRHDLCTPLVAIKGFGELVQDEAGADGLATLADGLAVLLKAAAEVLAAIHDAFNRPDGEEEEAAAPAEPVPPPARSGGTAKLTGRILVVDDNPLNRELLLRHLTREGHQALSAATGTEALALLAERDVDVVLLDVMMPGVSGPEVLSAIKADPALVSLSVIMVSALSDLDSIVQCIEKGATDYLPKPFNPVLLRARIGASLENKRLRDVERSFLAKLEKELDAAAQVQSAMLPKTFPPHAALAGHGLMVPAREVGGDFYDFFVLDEHRVGIAVGDVSGKGVPAAVYMAVVRTLLRATAMFGLSPAACLSRLNDQLCAENDQGMFVSLFYGIVDCGSGRLTYANGGHNWPLRISADGRTQWIEGTGDMLVGVLYGYGYREAELTLAPGDSVFAYTDGVVEAAAPDGAAFGNHRLAEVLAAATAAGPAQAARSVLDAVTAFAAGEPQFDDITCVAVRFHGAPAGDRFAFHMENRLAELPRLMDALEGYLARRSVPVEAACQLGLMVDETVAGIVANAYAAEGGHAIEVSVVADAAGAVIDIADDGRPFDATSECGEGGDGLGVHLVRSFADSRDYRRDGGRNHLHIVKTFPCEEPR